MNEEEIEELKDFTIDLTDIDELALGLEVCSKKSNMVIQEFADTIIQLQQENKKLKEQVEDKENIACNWKDSCLENAGKVEKLENQQKEFVEYMNKTIEELECGDVDDEEMKGYIIQRIDTFKDILQKYKEIIGGK